MAIDEELPRRAGFLDDSLNQLLKLNFGHILLADLKEIRTAGEG